MIIDLKERPKWMICGFYIVRKEEKFKIFKEKGRE